MSTASAEVPATAAGSRRTLLARRARGRRSMWRLATVTLLVGLIITGVLTALSRSVYQRNEHRLLALRVRDAAALFTTAVPSLQASLASAAELADATDGSKAKFRAFAAGDVKSGGVASVSLWDLKHPGRAPVAVVGAKPELATQPSLVPAFMGRIRHSSTLSVIGLLHASPPRLGYGYSTPGNTRYAVYAEAVLPMSRYAPGGKGSPFAGLRYALYLDRARPADLLVTDVHSLPLHGTVTDQVPFGDSRLVLAMATQSSLAGALPQQLPWIIAIAGVLLSLAAAAGALRLSERRVRAEGLAGELEMVARENRQLYAEQHGIAQALQHALLPEELPQLPGLQASGRYVAGERSMDIGGDWYDVITLSEGSVLLAVGDVSGRGLSAATTMASLRFAIQAFATEEERPEVILSKLSGLLNLGRDGQLATALCARIDAEPRQVTVASAGHLPALLLSDGEARFLDAPVGVPVGVDAAATYRSLTVPVGSGATLLAFTDGLVERRGEQLDTGLERLRNSALRRVLTLPELLDGLVADLTAGEAKDDIAIVGLRWTT